MRNKYIDIRNKLLKGLSELTTLQYILLPEMKDEKNKLIFIEKLSLIQNLINNADDQLYNLYHDHLKDEDPNEEAA